MMYERGLTRAKFAAECENAIAMQRIPKLGSCLVNVFKRIAKR